MHSNGDFEQRSYIYGNDIWKDQLTAMSYMDTEGEVHYRNFTYDEVGNPLAYDTGKKGWFFTWKKGRQLATATSIDLSIINTYDVDGIRDSKTVRTLQNGTVTGSERHDYTTLGGKIVREAYGANVIDYFYDNNGSPYKIVVKAGSASPVTGYFVLNLQGDVIGIIDGDGTVAVEYQYDAWGKEISHTTAGDDGSTLYNHNALKYRGYYYDTETGFYYVSSRYYDPEIGRFINADTTDVLTVNQMSLKEKNLYAYCNNNPVVYKDVTGTIADTALDIAFIAGDLASIIANPQNVVGYVELAADLVGLAVPGLTGGGKIVRAVMNSDNVLDTAKIADKVIDSKKMIKGVSKDGIKLHNVYDPIKKAALGDNKLLGKALKEYGSKLKPDAVDFTNRIIYELKPYNKNAYKRALKQASGYANTLGGKWTIVIDMYR